jgi:hypothetical protein
MFLPVGLAVDSMFILTLARGGNLDFSTPESFFVTSPLFVSLVFQLFFSSLISLFY